jgi:hypothetical protein
VLGAFIVAERAEIVLGVGLILVLILVIFLLARRRKPDPKMALLLSLMETWPKDSEEQASQVVVHEEAEGSQEHSPLGPSSFTLSV